MTSVGYTSTSGVMSTSGNRGGFRPQSISNIQPSNVAKHRLPMQLNRQSQHVNRTIATQPHTNITVRNLASIARPLVHSLPPSVKQQPQVKPVQNFHYQPQHQQHQYQQHQKNKQQPSQQQYQQKKQTVPSVIPTVAGRVTASPGKDSNLDDDLLEGVVEKRPKYHKNIPLNYQYVLQDHNYGAPPPTSPPPTPVQKPLVNGIISQNGIARNQPHTLQQQSNYLQQHFNSNRTAVPNVFGIGTRGPPPGDESDVDSSEGEREVDPQGEETETAPEGEGDDEDSVTRCVCEFQHDDGYMISCDKCLVWQHVDCMGIDRTNIPDEYLCERCQPRRIDKQRAIALQVRKRQDLLDTDTSSDSSTSSEGNVPNNIPVRKPRGGIANRNRSEPNSRKNSSSGNNNNISVKQRRESAKEVQLPVQNTPRQNNRQTFRKKQAEKKPPVRRKSTPSLTLTPPEKIINEKKAVSPVLSPDSTSSVTQLRQWIDSYEEAVTNHYSPELRARIASIKLNGFHSDLKLPVNLTATPKCRVSLLPTGIKILVSSVSIPTNQPLLELRGKYILCGSSPSNRPTLPKQAAPLPGPHIFHYQIPKDGTDMCVDARTYGNDARFVRRSCKPNVEIRHCLEKGTLHLYLVTTKPIEKNTEITLPFETPGIVPCACGESICPASAVQPPPEEPKTHNGALPHLANSSNSVSTTSNNNINSVNNNDQPMDKRRRGRRRTVSETTNSIKNTPKPMPKPIRKISPVPKTAVSKPATRKISPVPKPMPKPPTPPLPPEPEKAPSPKKSPSPSPSPSPPPPTPAPPPPAPITTRSSSTANARKILTPAIKKEMPVQSPKISKREASDKKKKMTREERKMEAIMKAFERMEKDQARKQEVQARQAQRKDSTECDIKVVQSEPTELKKNNIEKEEVSSVNNKNTSRKRKFSTSRRKGRGKTQNSYQANLRPRRVLRNSTVALQRSQSPESEKTSSDEEENVAPAVVHSTPPRVQRTPSPPTTPLSQGMTTAAGLLMEFSNQSKYSRIEKSPLYDSPVHNQLNNSGHSTSSGDTPPTPMSKTCMLVAAAVGPLAPGFKFPKTKKGMLTSWFKSPESSPPAPMCSPPAPADDSSSRPGPGFAKKRWLRQAISEECDSPNSRPDMSVSPTDYVGPLKKRRLARESMSSDHSFTPPNTPTHNNDNSSQLVFEDEDETVSSPPEIKKNAINDVEGSSQDSEDIEGSNGGPRTPPAKVELANIKPKTENQDEEDEECNEYEDEAIKKELDENNIKEEVGEGKDNELNAAEKLKKEKASAIKRKLSISEYRQRKQLGGRNDGDQQGDDGLKLPTSPATSATSSMSSSDEEETSAVPDVITKSLMLEAALDTKISKSGPPLTRFNSAPTSVERQRENLTERLKREFGLFLSDDEEQEKIRRGTNPEPPPTLKDAEIVNKKKLPPPPPPLDPPSIQYPTMFYPPAVRPGGSVFQNHFPSSGQVQGLPPPPTLADPQYFTPSTNLNTFYGQLPH